METETMTTGWSVRATIDDGPWWAAYYGSAILDHAERHLRKQRTNQANPDLSQSIGRLRSARTDLRAVMEYLDGIAEVADVPF